jgi:hypothetical protein
MDILVVSDIHRQTDILQVLIKRHPTAKLFLDAGDSERREIDIEPFETVKGNCDFFIKNKYRIVKILTHQIYIFHGNQFLLNFDNLASLAKQNECDIIIHGHTHRPYYAFHNGIHILCPGSPSFPRTIIGATYGIISISEEEVRIKILKVHND